MIELMNKINWQKVNNLIPAIVQHYQNKQVLMLGYMDQEALQKTLESKTVYFFSRTKNRLWQKGETSGHFLNLIDIQIDCDGDTLLIQADPQGVTCHLGTESCFKNDEKNNLNFIYELEKIIDSRKCSADENSYVAKLFASGQKRVAQKVGEEGVEVALAAMAKEKNELISESADLFFHLLVLLQASDLSFKDVIAELQQRKR